MASGAGFPALAAAARAGSHGLVVAADISRAMAAIVARRARDADARNVRILEMDAGDLALDDESFDAVTNVYGLMFAGDPHRALAESRRVLKRGGRCAVVVWAEPAANPFFTVFLGVAARFIALPAPEPGAPGPFRFAAGDGLATLVSSAGFVDVTVERLEMTFDCGTPDDYLRIFRDVAWKARLASLSAVQLARFRIALAAAAEPHLVGGRLRLTSTSLCAAGSR